MATTKKNTTKRKLTKKQLFEARLRDVVERTSPKSISTPEHEDAIKFENGLFELSKKGNYRPRQVDIQKWAVHEGFTSIGPNTERQKKAGRAVVVLSYQLGNGTQITRRFAYRTKEELKWIKSMVKNMTPAKEETEKVLSPKPKKFTYKRVRKVMRSANGGSFRMVWKLTNGTTTKYFATRDAARAGKKELERKAMVAWNKENKLV